MADNSKDEQKTFLCFHAHFYQPPRENPWLDFVEIQDSAHPAHDWNERIARECYYPMAHARILDTNGKIVQIVNNYERVSFNIGPTLFSWLERYQPDLYQDIIEADRKSCERMNGHGNAIAQVYNHIIMPLADERDARTQIRWSIREFQRRFNRRPEGMWLAECGCHPTILRMLSEEGVQFTILAPSQADQVRKTGGREWYDVSRGNIDPFRPYRFFIDGKHSIDIFFYDGPLSQAVSFDNLLFDSRILAGHLKRAIIKDYNNQFITIATDGEVYGHHKAFGERALGYLLFNASNENGFEIANYGYFLEKHPPEWEVKIKEGDDSQGTAWSCAHGVRRWADDCGCRTGGDPKWNQKWRRPLRDALDMVAEEARNLYDRMGSEIFKDPWLARDHYVELLMNHSDNNQEAFFNEHLKDPSSHGKDYRVKALKLLEMQKQAMYMYTSCGWFFSEISGPEGVQILRYAARCVELYQNLCGEPLEDHFLEMLRKAPSNIPEFENGAGVYERFVRPTVVSFDKVVAHFAILSIFEEMQEVNRIYSYTIQLRDYSCETHGNMTLAVGHVTVHSDITGEEREMMFIVFRSGLFEFRCSVKLYTDSLFFNSVKREISEFIHRKHLMDIVRFIDEKFSLEYYSIRDMFLEEKRRILYLLSEETIRKFADSFTSLYDDHRGALYMFTNAGLKIPKEFKMAAQYTLNDRFFQEIERAVSGQDDVVSQFKKADSILRVAVEWGIEIESPETIQLLRDTILERMIQVTEGGAPSEEIERLAVILDQLSVLKLECDISKAQELFYADVIQEKRIQKLDPSNPTTHRMQEALKKLTRSLGFSKELLQ